MMNLQIQMFWRPKSALKLDQTDKNGFGQACTNLGISHSCQAQIKHVSTLWKAHSNSHLKEKHWIRNSIRDFNYGRWQTTWNHMETWRIQWHNLWNNSWKKLETRSHTLDKPSWIIHGWRILIMKTWWKITKECHQTLL